MMTQKRYLFPLLLICAEMAAYLSNDIYLPALPDLMREFKVDANQIQWSLSSWFLGSMSVQLFIGPLSDRFGRRPILISGMILFVISTLLCVLSPQLELLIFARFIQGSTVGFIIVAGYASIHELFDQKNAIPLLAKMNSITILAPALGPLVGGLILTQASWRWTFWPLFLLGVLVLILLVKWMPEPLAPEKRQALKPAKLLLQYKAIIKNPQFMLLLLAYSSIFCGFIAWLVAGPFLVITQFHYEPFIFGLLQILVFGFYILSNRLVKRMMETLGVNQLIVRGLTLTFLGASLAILNSLLFPSYLSGLILGMMVYSFGFGFCSAPLQRLAIEAASEPMGCRMAILSTSLGVFGLFSTILVNLSYNGQLISLSTILGLTATVAILACLLEKRTKELINSIKIAS
jgi:Bcr/CflA subfamily drug resistance transporter